MESRFSAHKLAAIAISSLLFAAGAFAIPAPNRVFTSILPDGSMLEYRIVGDERARIYLTADGCPILPGSDGLFYMASIAADGQLVMSTTLAKPREQRSSSELLAFPQLNESAVAELIAEFRSVRPKGCQPHRSIPETVADQGPGLFNTTFPAYGEQKAIVILVEYADVKFGSKNGSSAAYSSYSDSENPALDYWTDQMNQPGFEGFGAVGSARDWFLYASRNSADESRFAPHFDVFGPVSLPYNMSYYGANSTGGFEANAHKMVVDACSILDPEVDFSEYDRDGNGVVDNIYIFYAGFGENEGGGADCIWPHSDDLIYMDACFEVDGVKVNHYACSNETQIVRRAPGGLGTFIHEFSHVLGIPDLYPTDKSNSYTPGAFSVMDQGPYNNNGLTPPTYSAYERWALGWIRPERFGPTGVHVLHSLGSEPEAFIVETENPNEYFLIENRQLEDWDLYLPGHGMLIWHIDYDKEIFDNNVVNNTPAHQHVDLVEANGKKSPRYADGHPFPGASDITDFVFSDWNKEECGVYLSDITETDGVIKMNVRNEMYRGGGVQEMIENDEVVKLYGITGVPVDYPQPGQLLIRLRNGRAEKLII